MRLIDAIARLENLDREATLYAARPWGPESKAIVAREPEGGGTPLEAHTLGLEYFLEVFIARDLLNGWTAEDGSDVPLLRRTLRLIQYAETDA
jgi:hypothetical protein